MPTVAFCTLGCKVNFYDTEGIWHTFQAAGYEQVPFENVADVYVINTCTVTNTGDKKSRQMIRRAVRTNPSAIVVATGCYTQVAPDEVASIAGVDLVVGNDSKSRIVKLVEEVRDEHEPYRVVNDILKSRDFEEFDVPYFEDRTRANLKIQDGCNNFCTFCLIPYARGLIRSRKPERILAQARKLGAAGYREIVLTGIHTGGYGADLGGYRLAHLLSDLEKLDEVYRIRISSIEASEIDDDLIEVLGGSKKICPHLHIPLQAGHNSVLTRMNRHYTVAEYREKIRLLREKLPGLAVTSDVIVGFPGETDEQFEATWDLIRELAYSQLHVFPYSPKRGTPAAKFVDQVDESVKEERVAKLMALSLRLTEQYAYSLQGQEVEVIPEGPLVDIDRSRVAGLDEATGQQQGNRFFVEGHAGNYLRVAFPVPEGVSPESIMGEVCRVRLVHVGEDMQQGEFVSLITRPTDGTATGEDLILKPIFHGSDGGVA